jgi:hypothetical protein
MAQFDPRVEMDNGQVSLFCSIRSQVVPYIDGEDPNGLI